MNRALFVANLCFTSLIFGFTVPLSCRLLNLDFFHRSPRGKKFFQYECWLDTKQSQQCTCTLLCSVDKIDLMVSHTPCLQIMEYIYLILTFICMSMIYLSRAQCWRFIKKHRPDDIQRSSNKTLQGLSEDRKDP